MLGIFKKKDKDLAKEKSTQTSGELLRLKIGGMHCTSCSMNVDSDLEDLPGVISATTSYAKQISKIEYDKSKVSQKEIEAVITGLGYTVG